VQRDRQKAAEKFRAMHERLSQLKSEIAQRQALSEAHLHELQGNADAAYAAYLATCAALEAARTAVQSAIAPRSHEAEGILRELNRPIHEGQVRQWATWTDERRLPGSEY
jgi:hypothetical protein